MTTWNTEELLNVRQISYLLGRNPRRFVSEYQQEGLLPEPATYSDLEPLWEPEQIGPLILESDAASKERINLVDTELLTTKQIGALHVPPVQAGTFDSYVRRSQRREAAGLDSVNPAPLPDKKIFAKPLWHPSTIRAYLRGRTGPGNHITGDKRRAYKGGRRKVEQTTSV